MPKRLPPIHPGEVLHTILADASLSANQAALAMRIPANRLTAIIQGKRSISADTALRLARYFGTSAEMWINLQAKYDLETAQDLLAKKVASEVRPLNHAA